MKYIVYDIETLKNIITFCFLDYETRAKKSFILYDDIEEFKKLVRFLNSVKKNGYWLVGFNCNAFDNQILEEVFNIYTTSGATEYTIESIITILYNKAQLLITLPDEEKFKIMIPEWKFSIPHIDLFKQKHYDRQQKATSLKWLQFTMRCANVQEMPIDHDSIVRKEDIPSILEYNWNDVEATTDFFELIKYETDLRITLSDRYNLKLYNASEPRMVREIFGKLLSEDMGIPYSELKKKQTFRTNVRVKDIIFPYIKFETEQCNEILEWFKSLDVNPNTNEEKVEKAFKFAQCETIVALGGIHGCIDSGRYTTNKNFIIKDLDVVSFYPNLAIQNDIRPEHLGETFNKIYNNIFQERITIPKKDPMNYIFKIILNSCYGLSKEKNGYIYDPKFTYSITINGQLTLLMLAEQLLLKIPNIVFYQLNTDGVTVGYDPIYSEVVQEIMEEFTRVTKQKLEEADYKEMIIRDVNNYIGVYTKEGKEPKKKGIFETNFNWEGKQAVDYHKNPSFNIIPLAVEAYFLRGEDYKKFIENHEDIYDFLGAVKKKGNFDLCFYSMINGIIEKGYGQKVTRFYIAKNGRKFVKDFADGRRTSILKDWFVEPANHITPDNEQTIRSNINYAYYIIEVERLISSIEESITQLKLF